MICKKIDISVDSYQETAALYTYFLDNSPEMIPDRKRPLVLICPGGGYEMTSDREAEPVAIQYIAKGYQAAILRYSVKPAKYPLALLQLAKAVAHLREYADEYHIDTEKNSGTGIFRRRSSGMQPWSFLEETVSFRNTWRVRRTDPAKRNDPVLSGYHFRGICPQRFF